jgi:hypothetical protein
MTFTLIQQVRMEVSDTDTSFPILDDSTYQYFLDKNSNSIPRSSLDAARAILFRLSINSTDSSVDIFSIKGSKAAAAYREALILYIKDPSLNPVYNLVQGYVGGVSKTDMLANDATLDNNIVAMPKIDRLPYPDIGNPFKY